MVSHMEQPQSAAATQSVAAYISARLADLGISQRDASERSGIPLSTLSRRLGGRGPFPLDEVAALAALIREPLAQMFANAAAAVASSTSTRHAEQGAA